MSFKSISNYSWVLKAAKSPIVDEAVVIVVCCYAQHQWLRPLWRTCRARIVWPWLWWLFHWVLRLLLFLKYMLSSEFLIPFLTVTSRRVTWFVWLCPWLLFLVAWLNVRCESRTWWLWRCTDTYQLLQSALSKDTYDGRLVNTTWTMLPVILSFSIVEPSTSRKWILKVLSQYF